MNEDLYIRWKEHRRQVPVPENFAARVMAETDGRAPAGDPELPLDLHGAADVLLRWAGAGGLLLLGLWRLFYVAANLLQAQPLLP